MMTTLPDSMTAPKPVSLVTLLDSFFTAHQQRLLSQAGNVPSCLAVLLEKLPFGQLMQAASEEVAIRRHHQQQQQNDKRSAGDDDDDDHGQADEDSCNFNCSSAASVEPLEPLEWDENIRIENGPGGKGRHMKVAHDCSQPFIPTGTYLIREAVLSIAYRADRRSGRCALCARKVHRCPNKGQKPSKSSSSSGFFPCPSCADVVFCSRRCLQKGNDAHSAECCLTSLFDDCPLALHVYRLVGTLGLEKVVRFYGEVVEKEEEKEDKSLQFQQPNPARFELLDGPSQLAAFAIVDSFVEHQEEEMEPQKQLEMLRWALKVLLLLNHQQHYFDLLATNSATNYDQSELLKSDFTLLVGHLVSLLRKLSFNVFCWSECCADLDKLVEDDEEEEEIDRLNSSGRPVANCLCLGVSFVNHSCDASAFWEIDDGIFVLSSACTLNPGDEVTLTYGPHQFMDFHQRQRRLAEYHFTCGCPACLEDVSRLLCLRCTICSGPVYPSEKMVSGKETNKRPKCMVCGVQPYTDDDYEQVMGEVICTRTILLAHCRGLSVEDGGKVAKGFDEAQVEILLKLLGKLTTSLYLQSLPLIRLFSEAWHALENWQAANDRSLKKKEAAAAQLASLYLDALDRESQLGKGKMLQKWWLEESAVQRNLLLSKWWRVLNGNRNSSKNSKHDLLLEHISSVLAGKTWKFKSLITAKNDHNLDFHSWADKRMEAAAAVLR